MQCQNCGQENVPNARFCKTCGTALAVAPSSVVQPMPPAPSPAPPAAPSDPPLYVQAPLPVSQAQPAAWSPPAAQPYAPISSTRILRKVSPVSVLKIVAVIYGLLFAVFGCLFILLPGLIGSSLLGDFGVRGLGSGSILITLLTYVVGIVVAGGVAGVSAAIGALLYNLVSRYVGGVEIEIDSSP